MNSDSLNPKFFWRPLAIVVAFAFLYSGVLTKLGRDWWSDENYSHGLLVPFVIGFIIWSEWDEIRAIRLNPSSLLGIVVIVTAFLLLLGGTLGAELFTQRISMVVMIAGLVIWFFGSRILRFLTVPFGLLLLSIPIPQIIFNKIAFPLQLQASQAAVWGIRLFDVPTVRKGNVIEILPSGATQVIALEVVEACSGIRSLMTLMVLALILGYFTSERRGRIFGNFREMLGGFDFWRMAILMLAAIPIAVLTNAARVTATGVLTYNFGKRATEGTWHDASGWLVYVVALLLLIGVNLVLKKFDRTRTGAAEIPQSKIENPRPQSVLLVIAVLVVGGVFVNWFDRRGETQVERAPLSELSMTLGDWRQKGGEIRFGEATESVLRASDYTMREYLLTDGRIANVYVGYYASQRSGVTYHSPQNCLPGAGWVMKEPELIEIPLPDGKTFKANRYIIENGAYREVMIYWYQGRGRSEASEYRDKINMVWDSVVRRRSDGAMVRVMTSAGGDEAGATRSAVDLSARLAERLGAHVPE
ncbi:MAG: EpsI family protein [Acidobacteria bacterium]|nr:EpsI family protein [Acidobacteriota bacterium]